MTKNESDKNSLFTKMNWTRLFLLLALTAAIVIAFLHFDEQIKIWNLLLEMSWGWLVLSCVVQVLTYYEQGAVWWVALRYLHHPLSIHSMARLSLAKLFIDQALPSGGVSGIVLANKMLTKKNIESRTKLAVLASNIASHYLAYGITLAIGLIILTASGKLNKYILFTALLFDIALISAAFYIFSHKSTEKKTKSFLFKWHWLQKKLEPIFEALPLLHNRKLLLLEATFFQLTVYLTDAATIWVLLYAIGTTANFSTVYAAFILSSAARTLSITPAGIGVFEFALVQALSLGGVPVSPGLTATLLFRGLSFWIPMIPGYWAAHNLGSKK